MKLSLCVTNSEYVGIPGGAQESGYPLGSVKVFVPVLVRELGICFLHVLA